jgi:hypothetical protein
VDAYSVDETSLLVHHVPPLLSSVLAPSMASKAWNITGAGKK